MANLPLTNSFTNNIYQLETTDPVLGGVDGIDNLQAKQLGSNTLYLKKVAEQIQHFIEQTGQTFNNTIPEQILTAVNTRINTVVGSNLGLPRGYLIAPRPRFISSEARSIYIDGTIVARNANNTGDIVVTPASGTLQVSVNAPAAIVSGVFNSGRNPALNEVSPNQSYHLYAVSNGTLSGCVWDTQIGTTTFTISGQTFQARRLPLSLRTNASSNFNPFAVTSWGALSARIQFIDIPDTPIAPYLLFDGSASSGWNAISTASIIPASAHTAIVACKSTQGSDNPSSAAPRVRPTGSTGNGIKIGHTTFASGNWRNDGYCMSDVSLGTSNQFDLNTLNYGSHELTCIGYELNI